MLFGMIEIFFYIVSMLGECFTYMWPVLGSCMAVSSGRLAPTNEGNTRVEVDVGGTPEPSDMRGRTLLQV